MAYITLFLVLQHSFFAHFHYTLWWECIYIVLRHDRMYSHGLKPQLEFLKLHNNLSLDKKTWIWATILQYAIFAKT